MKKTFSSILDRMTHLLNELGSTYDSIRRDPKIYRTGTDTYEQAIRVEKDGHSLEIIVEATCIAAVTNTRRHEGEGIPGFHHLAFDWAVIFNVNLLNNTHELTLLLRKETAKDKLTKLLWKRDLEVFDEAFDADFWIESNNSYAYGMLLDAALQEQLLANEALFGTLDLQKNKVHYKESLLKEKEVAAARIKRHYKSMLAICFTLAKKVEEWEPPFEA